jgi:Fe-S cluster assembly iron-binding protein IscA
MLQLDKKTVTEFESEGIQRLKVFFYEAGCSGTKINMETEFEVTDDIEKLETEYQFELYVPKSDKEHLEHARITRVVVADHTGIAKTRYVFSSDEVEDRCGCGTSFAFEKPAPVIDLEKLKKMRENFKKKSILSSVPSEGLPFSKEE